jgi:hypothetical protein
MRKTTLEQLHDFPPLKTKALFSDVCRVDFSFPKTQNQTSYLYVVVQILLAQRCMFALSFWTLSQERTNVPKARKGVEIVRAQEYASHDAWGYKDTCADCLSLLSSYTNYKS